MRAAFWVFEKKFKLTQTRHWTENGIVLRGAAIPTAIFKLKLALLKMKGKYDL